MRILIIILSLLLFTSCSIFIGNTYTMPGGEGPEPGDKVVLRFKGCRGVRIDGYRLQEMSLVKGDVKLHDDDIAKRNQFKVTVIVPPGQHNIEISNGYSKFYPKSVDVDASSDEEALWVPCNGSVYFQKGHIYEIEYDWMNNFRVWNTGTGADVYYTIRHHCSCMNLTRWIKCKQWKQKPVEFSDHE